jgi:hypothetical protein
MKPKPTHKSQSPIEGNVARAGNQLGSQPEANRKPDAPRLRLIADVRDEYSEAEVVKSEVLPPAKRIAAIIGVSFLLCALWFFVVFLLYQLVRIAV